MVRATDPDVEHVGGEVAPAGELVSAHERLTVPTYPDTLDTVIVEVAVPPAVIGAGAVAERAYTGVTEILAEPVADA